MDNLTHTVVGLAVGEFVHRSLPQEPDAEAHRLRRGLLLFSGWAASNFPDLDLVFGNLLPAPLGYLLHHRGHTHTLLYAIPQALLLALLICSCWPAARKLLMASKNARTGFGAAICVGLVLHIAMDYLNSYGVHPFHPFDPRWFYGDMIFILEPVFWIAFGIPMAIAMRGAALRNIFLVLLAGAPLFFAVRGFLSWASIAVLAIIAVATGLLQKKAGARGTGALLAAFGLSAGFIAIQHAASGQGRLTVLENLQHRDPASRVLDVAMTPFPANPLCWVFVSVESNESADTYRLRRGMLSLAPDLLPVSACPAGLSERAAQKETTPAIALVLEEQGNLTALRKLRNENCHFAAWLRFARVPSVSATEASDIRFASGPRGNFTTLRFADFSDRECSRFIPQWDFPRSDLLMRKVE